MTLPLCESHARHQYQNSDCGSGSGKGYMYFHTKYKIWVWIWIWTKHQLSWLIYLRPKSVLNGNSCHCFAYTAAHSLGLYLLIFLLDICFSSRRAVLLSGCSFLRRCVSGKVTKWTQRKSKQNQNLCMDLWWVAEWIREPICKFTQVAKSCTSHTYTVGLWSACVDLCWVQPNGEKWILTLTNINLSSTKVNASRWPNKMPAECKLKTCIDLQVHFARTLV